MNLKSLLLVFMLGYLPQAFAVALPATYKGLIYPPLPAECKDDGGGIFGKDQAGNELAFAHMQCGSLKMVWLERFLRREDRHVVWQVDDVLVLPTLRKGQLMFDIDCEYKRDKSLQVIAIGTWVNREIGGFVKGISHAWVLDPIARRFKAVAVRDVACEVTEDRD